MSVRGGLPVRNESAIPEHVVKLVVDQVVGALKESRSFPSRSATERGGSINGRPEWHAKS